MSLPTLSMIVSAYDRPEHLKLCLQSLRLQTAAGLIQIFVADNSPSAANRRVTIDCHAKAIGEAAVFYTNTAMRECYEAAEAIAKNGFLVGDFLGFPSDDNWYSPHYCEKMLEAAQANSWDLVYCDALFDPRPSWSGKHCVMEGFPAPGRIDKGGFIVRRSLFLDMGGFPGKNGGASASDGLFCQAAAVRCAHGRVPEVMWFHG